MSDLRPGQILPAAQPVDVFIRPGQRSIASVGAPPPIPAPAGLATVGQAGPGSVQGSNTYQQLQAALAPFITGGGFTSIATKAVDLYASGEYQRGQNEAIRAQILANQQRQQSAVAFTRKVRELEKDDPIAALMLDQANPYRMAGRQNQVARLAALDAPRIIRDAYLATPEAPTWAEEDPRLTELKARSVQGLLKKWSLSESSPGFQDYVAGEINKAWDEVGTRHRADRNRFLDDTTPRLTALEMLDSYAAFRRQGFVRWGERGADGAMVMREARLGSAEFDRGVAIQMGDILREMAATSGVGGRASAYTKEALGVLLELANSGFLPEEQQDALDTFQEILRKTPGAPVGPSGERPPLGIFYNDLFLGAARKRSEMDYAAAKRRESELMDDWEDEATIVAGMDPGPEKEKAKAELVGRGRKAGLGDAEMTERLNALGGAVTQIAERDANPDRADAILNGMQMMLPHEIVARATSYGKLFQDSIAHLPPGIQQRKRQQFAEIAGRARKGVESGIRAALPQGFDQVLGQNTQAVLRAAYPKTLTEAATRGVRDIAGWMAYNEPNFAAAAARVSGSMRQHMVNRLVEARRANGGRLDPDQELQIITTAATEFANTTDRGVRERMLPGGLGGGPGLNGGRVEAGARQGADPVAKPPPGRKFAPGRVVDRQNLQNLDTQTLERGEFTLDKPGLLEEIQRVGNGQRPSTAVQRAAKAAGMSLADFLIEQARRYDGLLNPQAERELRKRANTIEGVSRNVESAPKSSWLSSAGWFLDAVMGVRPAMAVSGGGRYGTVPFPLGGG